MNGTFLRLEPIEDENQGNVSMSTPYLLLRSLFVNMKDQSELYVLGIGIHPRVILAR